MSFNLFGNTSTTSTTTSSSSFLFGAKPATTTTPSLFSFKPTTTTSSSLFGNTTSQSSMFSFAKPTTTQSTALTTTQQTLTTPSDNEIILKSITMPQMFNDKRDSVMIKWNQLQLSYGDGTVFCGLTDGSNKQIKIEQSNQYAAFKGFTYGTKPRPTESDDMVVIIIKKKQSEIQKQSVIDFFTKMFNGSNNNVLIEIVGMKPLSDSSTEVRFRLTEKQSIFALNQGPFATSNRKIPATQVVNYIENQVNKSSSTTSSTGFSFGLTQAATNWKNECEKMGITEVFSEAPFSNSDLELYLNNPPEGITASLWKQANVENPDKDRLIPIPIIGFEGLMNRLNFQITEKQIQDQQARKMKEQIDLIRKNLVVLTNRATELKRCAFDSSHRLLKIQLMMNMKIKEGSYLSRDEEILYASISTLLSRLSSSSKSNPKIRLNALSAKMDEASNSTLNEIKLKQIPSILNRLQDQIELLIKR